MDMATAVVELKTKAEAEGPKDDFDRGRLQALRWWAEYASQPDIRGRLDEHLVWDNRPGPCPGPRDLHRERPDRSELMRLLHDIDIADSDVAGSVAEAMSNASFLDGFIAGAAEVKDIVDEHDGAADAKLWIGDSPSDEVMACLRRIAEHTRMEDWSSLFRRDCQTDHDVLVNVTAMIRGVEPDEAMDEWPTHQIAAIRDDSEAYLTGFFVAAIERYQSIA